MSLPHQASKAPPNCSDRTSKIELLPAELLIHIYTHLPTAQAVARLSQTCRTLHEFTLTEGWKVFHRSRFPSISLPSDVDEHAEIVHSLTSLSKAYDQKAFVAQYIEPPEKIINGTTGELIKWERAQGQTMGFQPCVDSYEECNDAVWTRRRQVLTFSVGASLMLRVREKAPPRRRHKYTKSGKKIEDRFEGLRVEELRERDTWCLWKKGGAVEGRDDITSLNLDRPVEGLDRREGDEMLVGTASGGLGLLKSSPDHSRIREVAIYNTRNRPVRSTHIRGERAVACLSDSVLALYPLRPTASANEAYVEAADEFEVFADTLSDRRVWTTRFLTDTRLAAGVGYVQEPIHLYELTPSGISRTPIRKFGLSTTTGTESSAKNQSGYVIQSLPATSGAGHIEGEVFLSGCYDGIIRMHDVRSPHDVVNEYYDPNDHSAIYCLQTLGRERVVIGSSRYSLLKFFDLRISGGRAYSYTDASHSMTPAAVTTSFRSQNQRLSQYKPAHATDWNLFLKPRNTAAIPAHVHPRRRHMDSPIYSLSSPSSFSPSLFAGVEGNVLQLDFTNIADHHPDPIYIERIKRIPKAGYIDVKNTWNPKGKILNLGMYEHNGEGAVRLRVQRGVGRYEGSLPGLDGRWRDSGDDR